MKKFRLFAALMMAVVCVSLSSCSKDDEEKNSIVGKWELITKTGMDLTHVTYKSNGTFENTSSKDADYEEHGKYKIDGTKLYKMFSDEDDWAIYNIITLSSEALTLQELDDDGVTPYGKPYSFMKVE